jgi:hypothetical protein
MAWFSMGPAIIKPNIVYLLFKVRFAVVPLAGIVGVIRGAVLAGGGRSTSVGKVRIALCVVVLRLGAILTSLSLSLLPFGLLPIGIGYVVKKAENVSGG